MALFAKLIISTGWFFIIGRRPYVTNSKYLKVIKCNKQVEFDRQNIIQHCFYCYYYYSGHFPRRLIPARSSSSSQL